MTISDSLAIFRFDIVSIIGRGGQEMIGDFENPDDGAYPLQVLSGARGVTVFQESGCRMYVGKLRWRR
jgi:hypothetical protein